MLCAKAQTLSYMCPRELLDSVSREKGRVYDSQSGFRHLISNFLFEN